MIKQLIKQFARYMTRELVTNGEVKIPGFGKLYVSKVLVRKGVHPLSDDLGPITTTKTVRFRPYLRLKAVLNGTVTLGPLFPGEEKNE